MAKAIIIDDENLARELVKAFLKNTPEIEVIGEYGDGFAGIKAIKELNPDLVFLDIQMPKLTGFEMLEILDQPVNIIFTTAYDQYAIQAFDINAIDYLLKPFSQERFDVAVHKALERIRKGENDLDKLTGLEMPPSEKKLNRIIVKTGSKVKVIAVEDIYYFEALDDFVGIFTSEGKFLKQVTMKYLESNLDSGQFHRIHRSYIVNMDYIEHLEPYEKNSYKVKLKNGERLPVSRTGYASLRERFGK